LLSLEAESEAGEQLAAFRKENSLPPIIYLGSRVTTRDFAPSSQNKSKASGWGA
jgi:hypothetical protein